ncbi:hypothetical protein ACR3IL_09010 [Streptococcus iniae]|uniref:hypothetical protein n=1 Tax=Streptococcus agalactiae TaxID=1311 RepID=UPI0008DA1278|nr:hypothetical protein [Streptococcus agalactiae]ELY5747358.1 hypothetical protein [Streptococcus iniae]KAF0052045.1 hypothetical protein GL192_00765 [Streptococcus agalactiae]OHX26609.1 hypothetical protein BKX95_09535 [Streptococcus iniae]
MPTNIEIVMDIDTLEIFDVIDLDTEIISQDDVVEEETEVKLSEITNYQEFYSSQVIQLTLFDSPDYSQRLAFNSS